MVVVITGASAGVGRATAQAFANAGASLGLIARGKDRLNSAVRDAKASGVTAMGVSADVADARAI
jgi:NADP-dependent 3-hydroxy acid dehydrogenase YdfG